MASGQRVLPFMPPLTSALPSRPSRSTLQAGGQRRLLFVWRYKRERRRKSLPAELERRGQPARLATRGPPQESRRAHGSAPGAPGGGGANARLAVGLGLQHPQPLAGHGEAEPPCARLRGLSVPAATHPPAARLPARPPSSPSGRSRGCSHRRFPLLLDDKMAAAGSTIGGRPAQARSLRNPRTPDPDTTTHSLDAAVKLPRSPGDRGPRARERRGACPQRMPLS